MFYRPVISCLSIDPVGCRRQDFEYFKSLPVPFCFPVKISHNVLTSLGNPAAAKGFWDSEEYTNSYTGPKATH
jgi:hypothetical protein